MFPKTNRFGKSLLALVVYVCAAGMSQTAMAQPVRCEGGPELSVPLGDVPVAMLRRATQLLYDRYQAGAAPSWSTAVLGACARPLFRPDITSGPAYYEFAVEQSPRRPRPTGFIVLATGTHDYPVAHWSASGLPYTEQLRLAAAGIAPIGRYYKLDALGYYAESTARELIAAIRDSNGQVVTTAAELQSMVPRLVWDGPLGTVEQRTQWAWQPPNPVDGSLSPGILTTEGPEGSPFHFDTFTSWSAALAGYRESAGPVNESIRAGAERMWRVEAIRAESGEGLFPGAVRTFPLLSDQAEWRVYGPTEGLVQADAVTLPNERPAVRITVRGTDPTGDARFRIRIMYPNRVEEDIPFAVIDPIVVSSDPDDPAQMPELQPGVDPSPPDDRWCPNASAPPVMTYDQLAPNQAPNQWHCWTGCGATAWANLIGWTDNQAWMGSPQWQNALAMYRVNGSINGPVAQAPTTFDPGPQNTVVELGPYIHTQCFWPFDQSGFTIPTDMSGAWRYFQPRNAPVDVHTSTAGGAHFDFIRDAAIDSLCNRSNAVVVGIGDLSHYALARKYHVRYSNQYINGTWHTSIASQEFELDMGWGANHPPQVMSTSIFLAGWITPH